ncbi:hypothetical protein GGQ22_07895 [Nocardioides sp. zg-579]|uniref:Calcium-binding protein n=1 Tax=Nocardioides marmotae TaxID=2663857 RepID=A0A6I3J345_9ACTN|nr:calcium-binding protein [Nocardioides marmotae]MCR6031367.1 hypothetical protein [Gordonia jinghuaiqii]MTB95006.1 hypothetical protein [Nocardioides marmotae]QKE02492.1 hypothetical protein HPC71_16515 [Nocardioides marmotae]
MTASRTAPPTTSRRAARTLLGALAPGLVIGLATGLLLTAPPGPAGAAGEPDPPPVTCDGLVATIVGTEDGETLVGTDGDDVIAALGGADRVEAGAGDDVVCGGDRADVLEGGPGADRLFGEREDTDPDVDLAGDVLVGGPGDDHLDGGYDPRGRPDRDQLSWRSAPRGVHLDLGDGVQGTATGEGHDTLVLIGSPVVIASQHADTVLGSPGRDRIHALGGGDRISTGAGDDEVVTDKLHSSTAPDVVRTGTGDDRVWTTVGADRVFLGPGRDSGGGGGTGVRLHGGPGGDYLDAIVGASPGAVVHGDGGPDHLSLGSTPALSGRGVLVDLGRGVVRPRHRPAWSGGVVGIESLFVSGDARWTVRGTPGPDTVRAPVAEHPVVARLGRGADDVEGGLSADLLDGGPGRDRVDGGPGRDRCLHAEVAPRCEVRR